MEGLDNLAVSVVKPLAYFGIEHSFFDINIHTIIQTWIVIGIIIVVAVPTSLLLRNHLSILSYALIEYIRSFYEMVYQTLGVYFSFNHFAFITALFTFIVLCNALGAIPWLDEPTKDLNTTLSLGLSAFFYTQFYAIKEHGLWSYIKEYFAPFFIMLPLNIIGKLATIISISFRLFGNIFGGYMITHIYTGSIKGSLIFETLGIITGINILITFFFGLFEAFLQAFVFAMLALTYLSLGLHGEAPKDDEE